jgi:hypothetical protein
MPAYVNLQKGPHCIALQKKLVTIFLSLVRIVFESKIYYNNVLIKV